MLTVFKGINWYAPVARARLEQWVSIPQVGVKTASGSLQGSPLLKTCFQRCGFGPAKGGAIPRIEPYSLQYIMVRPGSSAD